jgi:NAD(P)-dependent dehydrogenase (short-subunit alcohol dehydrogenase family)
MGADHAPPAQPRPSRLSGAAAARVTFGTARTSFVCLLLRPRREGINIVVANGGVEQVDERALEFTAADFDRLFGADTKGASFTLQRAVA